MRCELSLTAVPLFRRGRILPWMAVHEDALPFGRGGFSLPSMEEKESAGAAEQVDAIIGELETLQQG